MGTFGLEHLNIIFEPLSAFLSKFGRISKIVYRRVKWKTIWTSLVYVVCIWVPLTLNLSGSFWSCSVHFPQTGNVRERNWQKFGSGGGNDRHMNTSDLEHVKVIWGHSVKFFENWTLTQKSLFIE